MTTYLKKRPRAVLNFIKSFHAERGYMPTLAEIAKGTGLSGASSAQYVLDRLVDAGVITIHQGRHRGIQVHDNDPAQAKPASFVNLAFDTGVIAERKRITAIIQAEADTWTRQASFNYRTALAGLIERINITTTEGTKP